VFIQVDIIPNFDGEISILFLADMRVIEYLIYLAAKAPPGPSSIIFVASRHVECVVLMSRVEK
jgi:hypothetical protein